jgi:hypothetical protein
MSPIPIALKTVLGVIAAAAGVLAGILGNALVPNVVYAIAKRGRKPKPRPWKVWAVFSLATFVFVVLGTIVALAPTAGESLPPALSLGVTPRPSQDTILVTIKLGLVGEREIYSVKPDTREFKLLVKGEMPVVSPDGSQIVFRSDMDGSMVSYIMNRDGSNQRLLSAEINNDLAWFPDGKRVLGSRHVGDSSTIWSVATDGTQETQLSTGAGAVLSPTGNKIAFHDYNLSGVPDIYVLDLTTMNVTRLTYDGGAYPAWSPDASSLSERRVCSSEGTIVNYRA